MRKIKNISMIVMLLVAVITVTCFALKDVRANAAEVETVGATSEEEAENGSATGSKAIAAGIVVGLASAAGALGMGIAVAKSNESIARQPEAASKINSTMMLGLVFIETAIIYALIVAILVIFVL